MALTYGCGALALAASLIFFALRTLRARRARAHAAPMTGTWTTSTMRLLADPSSIREAIDRAIEFEMLGASQAADRIARYDSLRPRPTLEVVPDAADMLPVDHPAVVSLKRPPREPGSGTA